MEARTVVLYRMGVGLVLGLGIATPALAGDPGAVCPVCRKANEPTATYPQKVGTTLVRGVANTAFGWTELLLQPAAEVNAGGGLVKGIGKGVGYAMKRTALGVGELLTFWTPKGKGGYLNLAEDCPVCMMRR